MGNTGGRPSSLGAFIERYRPNRISAHNQMDLSEGVCHGMCLDWIRMIIHGHGAVFRQLTTSTSQFVVRRVLTVQARTHELFQQAAREANARLTGRQQQHIAVMRQLKQQNVLLHQNATRLQDRGDALDLVHDSGFLDGLSRGNLGLVLNEMDQGIAQRLARFDDNNRELRAHGDAVTRLTRIMQNDEQRYSLWYRAFQRLYRQHDNSALHVNFDDVRYRAATNAGNPSSEHIDWFAGILACIRLLNRGECALLNFLREDGGHFVAFHYDGAGYHLFDPNTGWYRIDTPAELAELFHDLWHAVYKDLRYNRSEWRVFMV